MELIDGVEVTSHGEFSKEEIRHYLKMARDASQCDISRVELWPKGNSVQIDWTSFQRKFERIRRITGRTMAVC